MSERVIWVLPEPRPSRRNLPRNSPAGTILSASWTRMKVEAVQVAVQAAASFDLGGHHATALPRRQAVLLSVPERTDV